MRKGAPNPRMDQYPTVTSFWFLNMNEKGRAIRKGCGEVLRRVTDMPQGTSRSWLDPTFHPSPLDLIHHTLVSQQITQHSPSTQEHHLVIVHTAQYTPHSPQFAMHSTHRFTHFRSRPLVARFRHPCGVLTPRRCCCEEY